MGQKIAIKLLYDGSRYLGWQKAKEGPTIEGVLQEALSTLFQENIELEAASRTDAGVHAKGQIVSFTTEKEEVDVQPLLFRLNRFLPSDIQAENLFFTSKDFHPSLDAKAKEYVYAVYLEKPMPPFLRNYAYHFPYILDLSIMKKAAAMLIGKKDFSTFSNSKEKKKTRDKLTELRSITIKNVLDESFGLNMLHFTLKGDRFLYKMVRNIVGTLLYIGVGKIDLSIKNLIDKKDRKYSGITVPAKGLYLKGIEY